MHTYIPNVNHLGDSDARFLEFCCLIGFYICDCIVSNFKQKCFEMIYYLKVLMILPAELDWLSLFVF